MLARLRSLVRALRPGRSVRDDMAAEFRAHMELRARDLVHSGMDPDEARRQARLEFGSPELYHDLGRASRGLRPFDSLHLSWLDFKLGFRMLLKYPALTLIGGIALAFSIAVGAATFEIATRALHPTLPLPDGDRIVGVHNWDAATSQVEYRSLHDFHRWRSELRTIRELGAYRGVQRNLLTSREKSQPVAVAEISASAFALTRVRPLLGRTLVESDEAAGAPNVMVIGHDAWQARFGSDSSVIGRTVQLGRTRTTIVGVMPEGFGFPVRQRYWIPLRLDPVQFEVREGPSIRIFGRLAPGVSIDEAQVELTAIGQRVAAELRTTHEQLRPRVMPYARAMTDPSGEERVAIASMNLPVVMLLLLVCANVALLLFARAATREAEILVRAALGASRARIVTQLFTEALVLGIVAALAGIAGAGIGLGKVMELLATSMEDGRLPFWISPTLSLTTLLYVAGLTLLSAVVAGVMPALKVTRGLSDRLKATSAGAGGLRFGGVWTAVIVAQVAFTVAFPAVAFFTQQAAEDMRAIDVGFASQHYLAARIEMDPQDVASDTRQADTTQAAYRTRFASTYGELERRLTSDPLVAGITVANWLPRAYRLDRFIDVDDGGAASPHATWGGWYRVSTASVEPDFFAVLGVPILAGRGFHRGDLESGSRTVIVTESFVKHVLGGRHPLGRHLRIASSVEWTAGSPTFGQPTDWYEIVGVVPSMGMAPDDAQESAGFFLPVAAGDPSLSMLAVHIRGDPAMYAPRLRAIAGEIDPALRLYDVMPVDRLDDVDLNAADFAFRLLVGVSSLALMLALAGIYAVMAFTVARRSREIGIRVALGARPRVVLVEIFRRPVVQVALGVGSGTLFVLALGMLGSRGLPTVTQLAVLVGYAAGMMLVCLLACVVPTRRALGVQPTEVLKTE